MPYKYKDHIHGRVLVGAQRKHPSKCSTQVLPQLANYKYTNSKRQTISIMKSKHLGAPNIFNKHPQTWRKKPTLGSITSSVTLGHHGTKDIEWLLLSGTGY